MHDAGFESNRPRGHPTGGSKRQIERLDTLRAIAVTIVVVYHLRPDVLPWGYIGVDMFFTLSGFLMSYLYLTQNPRDGEHIVRSFVTRRFWRIFPPLAIVTVASILVAVAIMAPLHLIEAAESTIAATFSLSNFYFHSQSGYFDTDAITKPLLHTWSLGVEEQFYVLFAVALGLSRWVSLQTTLALLTLMSFAAWGYVVLGEMSDAISPIHDEPYSSLFFLPYYRFFQFSAGGLAAYAMLSGYGGLRGIGVFAFVIAAITASDSAYAHLSAPIVTCGMALMMVTPSRLDRAAHSLIVGYLARISYQLYLVHWPIIVFWSYFTGSPLNWIEAFLCLSVCIILADVLYRTTDWMRSA